MKKILLVTNVCTLILLYFAAFKTNPINGQKINANIADTLPKSFVANSKNCTPCIDYSKSEFTGLLSVNVAKQMASDYKTAQTDQTDARSVWFSIGTLKRFIWLIEKQSCGLCIDRDKLGLRIYYGKYPNLNIANNMGNPHLNGVPRIAPNDYSYKHTVFMVPTYRNGNFNVDYSPNKTINGCTPMPYSSIFGLIGDPQGFILSPNAPQYGSRVATGGGNEPPIQNHGDLMPPPPYPAPEGASFEN